MTETQKNKEYNEDGFLFDSLGRVREWRCPKCGDSVGRSLLTWPDNTVGIWNFRYRHLKKHEGENGKM